MKSLRFLLVLALVAGLALGVAGCNSDEDVAARVNGDEISLTELNKQVDELKKNYPTMFTGADGEGRLLDFKQRILDNLINQKLVKQASEEKGVEVTEADVEKQITQLKGGFTGDEQFQQALKSAGLTEDTLKDQVRGQLMQQKLIDKLSADAKKPTAEEIKEYYETNKTQFETQAAKRISQILFKPDDKATAEKVLAELKAGGDFATAAKQYSQDKNSSDKGGDLGWPTTPNLPEIETAIAKAKVGALVPELVKSTNGYHIVKVTDSREASTKSLEDATPQIEQIIMQQRKADIYQKFLEDLREKAEIEILVPELKASSGSTETTKSK